jgi:hypothetical protein
MIATFLHRWRHRLDFLARETAYQGRGLAGLLAALAFAPASGPTLLVLVATPGQARFLARALPWICRGRAHARLVRDLASLDACLAEGRGEPHRVLVAGELYARFHARLAADVAAGTVAVA